jgi:SAM-dependent methyltransferase
MPAERDYVLGTHDEELARLGLQHRVWRPVVLDCWQRAGITVGNRVLDVGAGPGYAAIDLAEIVGPSGEIVAVERSTNFIGAMEEACRTRALQNVRVQPIDLMHDEMPPGLFDFSWCRWVLCFVSDPGLLVSKIAGALRANGIAVFHEYVAYKTWSFLPPRPDHRKFVKLVTESWRATGGEPDIGLQLPKLLAESGLDVRSIRPHVFAITPQDYMWQWPASFVQSGTVRLEELGKLDSRFAGDVRAEFAEAERNAATVMVTPMVIEIIAGRQ